MIKKGMVTLSALLILSSALLLFLMLDEQILAMQRANFGERLRYLQQRENLLQQSAVLDGDRLCRAQSAVQPDDLLFFTIRFSDKTQDQQHKIGCRRVSLLQTLPQQAAQQGITRFLSADFERWQTAWDFAELPLAAADYTANKILWLDQAGEWQPEQDFYGVVIAKERLHLSGEGKIIGAVIYQTALLHAENQLEFSHDVVRQVAEKYRQWIYQQGSWHDFNTL
ncbi:Protein of unknown function [Pasteurella testudinis DSM 23072]|uniref:Uncharacterized protein n=1 Tax=Pasteurella testudinis DSM 23072 TaxID=1122938 RepID=A0A1W1V9T8_9PAST|nr:DUF2572 family protein [Pasteurella testudinis]SMB90159.1 Protein of unknown function [Pasteurella testudinis DSM 23072]SUB51345.1 membrane protein [Pasteurella testudinis]